MGRPSISLQRPPVAVCFLLPELALLPASVFCKLGAGLPLFARGPLEVPGDPSMAPGPLRHTPTASFPMGSTALT